MNPDSQIPTIPYPLDVDQRERGGEDHSGMHKADLSHPRHGPNDSLCAPEGIVIAW